MAFFTHTQTEAETRSKDRGRCAQKPLQKAHAHSLATLEVTGHTQHFGLRGNTVEALADGDGNKPSADRRDEKTPV